MLVLSLRPHPRAALTSTKTNPVPAPAQRPNTTLSSQDSLYHGTCPSWKMCIAIEENRTECPKENEKKTPPQKMLALHRLARGTPPLGEVPHIHRAVRQRLLRLPCKLAFGPSNLRHAEADVASPSPDLAHRDVPARRRFKALVDFPHCVSSSRPC